MNMASVPRTTCPYCRRVLSPWRHRRLFGLCGECHRPLALVPDLFRRPAYRIWNLLGIVHVVTLPIIGGALISFAIGDLPPRELVSVVSLVLLLWGATDLWDGYAGIRTHMVRTRTRVLENSAAVRVSAWKALAGAAALVIGITGLSI